jgi:hypothetical protein
MYVRTEHRYASHWAPYASLNRLIHRECLGLVRQLACLTAAAGRYRTCSGVRCIDSSGLLLWCISHIRGLMSTRQLLSNTVPPTQHSATHPPHVGCWPSPYHSPHHGIFRPTLLHPSNTMTTLGALEPGVTASLDVDNLAHVLLLQGLR